MVQIEVCTICTEKLFCTINSYIYRLLIKQRGRRYVDCDRRPLALFVSPLDKCGRLMLDTYRWEKTGDLITPG